MHRPVIVDCGQLIIRRFTIVNVIVKTFGEFHFRFPLTWCGPSRYDYAIPLVIAVYRFLHAGLSVFVLTDTIN